MSCAPDGDLPLSDDLFLIAHCDRTGRPRLHPLVCGVALGGGLLGELMLTGHLHAVAGRARLRGRRPPEDRTCRGLFDALSREPHRDLSAWPALLSRSAGRAVTARVLGSGLVVPVRYRRGLLARGTAYRPVDGNGAYWRSARLARVLDGPGPPRPRDVLLAGLVEACGLLPVATDGDGTGRALHRLEHELAGFGDGARELVDAVRLSVGDAVLGART